jgi:hypothetical protein
VLDKAQEYLDRARAVHDQWVGQGRCFVHHCCACLVHVWYMLSLPHLHCSFDHHQQRTGIFVLGLVLIQTFNCCVFFFCFVDCNNHDQ